jgi:hypothetical protein
MAIPSKIPPATDRFGSLSSRTIGSATRYPQPYLLTAQRRSVATSNLPLFPHESEDACLTGSTRSLYRRVLGLNVLTDLTGIKRIDVSSISISKIA